MNEGLGTAASPYRAPSPSDLIDADLSDTVQTRTIVEPPAPGHSPPPEPVPSYTGPEVDPWAVLRKELSPVALAALEQVTGKKEAAPGTAPWYECWDVVEGRPTGHPPFQGFVKPGQHVYCPFVDERTGACGRKTVRPLENYVPV